MVPDEFIEFEFAEKANALRVGSVLVGKVELGGKLANFGFHQVADGKNKFSQLLLS